MMNFIVEENRIFLPGPAGKVLAEVVFPPCGEGVVDVRRTFVDESLRGQGVAGQLMETLVSLLEKSGKKAVPTCSYAAAWFKKHPQARHLLCSGDARATRNI